jgi:opacity protein-like surface antigen
MRKLLGFLILTIFGGLAQAADSGFYLGAAATQSKIDRFSSEDFSTDDLNDFEIDDTNYKIIVGFRPLDLVAVELNYVDLGKDEQLVSSIGIDSANASIEAKALAGFALISLPIPAPFIDVYGKVGLARWETEGAIDFAVLDDIAAFDESGTDFAYGAGAQFNFGSLSARLEWENFDIDNTDGAELLSLGLTWTFL